MAELVSDRSKKSSVTQLVHSTIGLGLLKPAETAVPSSILSSPEEDNGAMASSSSSRLHFYTKRSAGGSVSSEKAAGLDPDSDGGLTSLDAAGGRRRGKGRLPHQPSQDGSVFGDDIEPIHALHKVHEVKRMGSDTELMGVHEALNYADQTASTRTSVSSNLGVAVVSSARDRSMSLQPYLAAAKFFSRPLSWEEDAVSNQHLFHEVDTREACYFTDSIHCQQVKLFHPNKRQKIRCSACKVLVHVTCQEKLEIDHVHCKETFREIRQKVRDTVVVHHFLNRRKPVGKSKCTKCDKGFGNWKFMTGKEIVVVSCSWCGDSYHVSCFSPRLHQEPCHMGPLRRLTIKPSWIIRVPQMDRTASQGDESPKPFSVTRRRTRKSRRKKLEHRPSKFFKVKAYCKQHKPLLVFINPKSGGNQGARLLQTFQWLLNPRQVFDLSKGSPKFGLKMYGDLSDIRILACGGDGTVGWVLSIIDELAIKPFPPVAVLPLGTGNDLSRVLGWGAGYSDEPLDKILLHVDEGPVVELDRWQINVWPNEEAPKSVADAKDSAPDVPIHVINNYFSIGADAQVALEFHLGREANPERFNNRIKNKFFYTKLGGKDILQRKFADLTDHLTIIGDGVDLTPRIRAQRLEAICFLNIPSHGAGTNPWGTPPSRDPKIGPQFIDDGRIEVVGFWAHTFAKLQVNMSHGERIAQCEHIKMHTTKSLPIQIDGEPCKLQPSIVEVILKNTAQVIRKVPRRNVETPLKGVAPTEQIKMTVSKVTKEEYVRLNRDVHELRRVATPLGLIMTSVEDTLDTVRRQIENFTAPDDNEGGVCPLAANWRFLESNNSGLYEKMFQVTPDQEHSLVVGNMPSDGIIVMEMDTTGGHGKGFFSPEDDLAENPLSSLVSIGEDEGQKPIEGRQLGRNHSYKRAISPTADVCPLPPPQALSITDRRPGDPSLQVPTGLDQKRGSIGSNQSEDGYEGDSETLSPSPLRHIDMGSDSTGGDTDAGSAPSSVQKALVDAVKRGQLKKVQQYHEAGAKLTVTGTNGWTPLHHAARLGKLEIVEYLVAHLPKEALDLVDDDKLQTPLHKAAWYGYVDICKVLVENGASLYRQDYQGNTALVQATRSGEIDLQQYLREKVSFRQKSLDNEECVI